MKITKASFYILPGEPRVRSVSFSNRGSLQKVRPGLSGLFSHSEGMGWKDDIQVDFTSGDELPTYQLRLRLHVEGGMDAYADWSSGFSKSELDWEAKHALATIMPLILGVDVLDREYIWQRLWYAQRFFYTGRQPLDNIDRMLWDWYSRYTCKPVYLLMGGARDEIPAYANFGGKTIDDMVESCLSVKERNFVGGKDHSYRGVEENSQMARELRSVLGDEFILLHDPVESYTWEEAIRIGRVLEECNYGWIEEPLQDYDIFGLQRLCAALDLSVLALEWIGAIGGQPFNAAPYVALGATDIVRQRGIGLTGQLKVAHMSEVMGVPVHGGDPHVILAVANDPLFEAFMGLKPEPPEDELDCRGTMVVDKGVMRIAWRERRPTEPDWDAIGKEALQVIE